MQARHTVLVVEAECARAAAIAQALEREGYSTSQAHSGEDAIRLASMSNAPDLVLLDATLPDVDGRDVLRELRGRDALVRVLVTGPASLSKRIEALELGADDWLTSPYSMRELTLRTRALLRNFSRTVPAPVTPETTVVLGRLRVDEQAYQTWVDGREVPLTALEFRLLSTLIARRGRAQSRQRLLEDVWRFDGTQTTRTVDTHVRRLRSKLGPLAACIDTVRGVGYRFERSMVELPE